MLVFLWKPDKLTKSKQLCYVEFVLIWYANFRKTIVNKLSVKSNLDNIKPTANYIERKTLYWYVHATTLTIQNGVAKVNF